MLNKRELFSVAHKSFPSPKCSRQMGTELFKLFNLSTSSRYKENLNVKVAENY